MKNEPRGEYLSLGRALLLPDNLEIEIETGKGNQSHPSYAGMNTCIGHLIKRMLYGVQDSPVVGNYRTENDLQFYHKKCKISF